MSGGENGDERVVGQVPGGEAVQGRGEILRPGGGDGEVPVLPVRELPQGVGVHRPSEAEGAVPLRGREIPPYRPDAFGGDTETSKAFAAALALSRLPSLCWAMPCYGSIHPKVYSSHMRAMGTIARMGFKVNPLFVSVSNKVGLVTASNRIVQEALAVGCDYIFWTEMDMDVPSDVIPRLFDRHKDVVSGLYVLRGSKMSLCAYRRHPLNEHRFGFTPLRVFQPGAFVKVDACGMGCVLFRTEIFRNKVFDRPGTSEGQVWFDEGQGVCGQDMYFYAQLLKAGVEVWLDTSVQCVQYDESEPAATDLTEYMKSIHNHGIVQGGLILGEAR